MLQTGISNWSILIPTADMFPPNSQNGMKADDDFFILFFFPIKCTGWLILWKTKKYKNFNFSY